jgi:hypothetical protein
MVSPVMRRLRAAVPAPPSAPPAGFDVTVYAVIGEPPSDVGAVMVSVTSATPGPRIAVTDTGASGTVAGVTGLDAADGKLVPAEFVAVTVKVYAVPFASPVMTWLRDVLPALPSTPPAGLDVTV